MLRFLAELSSNLGDAKVPLLNMHKSSRRSVLIALKSGKKKDLQNDFDGLILPCGESTVMGKLLKELDLFDFISK